MRQRSLSLMLKPAVGCSSGGFTLIEVLVVMIIAGVLAAIAAPGWNSFFQNQKISVARKQILQVLRETQSEAINKRDTRGVRFEFQNSQWVAVKFLQRNTATDTGGGATGTTDLIPTIPIGPTQQATAFNAANLAFGLSVKTSTNAAATVASPSNSIIFSYNGSVLQPVQEVAANQIAVVTFYNARNTNAKSCIIVSTLLGGMREENGTRCN